MPALTDESSSKIAAMTGRRFRKAAYAIFDLDGALHPATLGLPLLRSLAGDGVCDPRRAAELFAFVTSMDPEELRSPDSADFAYRLYARALEGVPASQVCSAAKQVWNYQRQRVFDVMRGVLPKMRCHGYRTVLISGSPHEIVAEAARDLGFIRYQGAVFTVRSGVYDASIGLAPGTRDRKSDIARRLAGNTPIDWERSTAIGNSTTDLELLSAVCHPVAFEPSDTLRAAAGRFGWPITDRTSSLEAFLAATRGISS